MTFPSSPWVRTGPLGVMQVADIELEIQRHLLCGHVWVYKHWTWQHSFETDVGFDTTGGQFLDHSNPHPLNEAPESHNTELYRSREEMLAIRRVSRIATEWTFKWCGNQVERGFTGPVVAPRRGPADIPLSEEGTNEWSEAKSERVQAWLHRVHT